MEDIKPYNSFLEYLNDISKLLELRNIEEGRYHIEEEGVHNPKKCEHCRETSQQDIILLRNRIIESLKLTKKSKTEFGKLIKKYALSLEELDILTKFISGREERYAMSDILNRLNFYDDDALTRLKFRKYFLESSNLRKKGLIVPYYICDTLKDTRFTTTEKVRSEFLCEEYSKEMESIDRNLERNIQRHGDKHNSSSEDKTELAEIIEPAKSFNDVVLPPRVMQQLKSAMAQIKNHKLIFNHWGLSKIFSYGRGIILNFAGPPGTGKTLTAEVIAYELKKKLCVVKYNELESCYWGESTKNIVRVFETAKRNNYILFFDEADAIATHRVNVSNSTDAHFNMDKNVLLKEIENFDGICIFATNIAKNLDKAFERRITIHILFEMPCAEERGKIWKLLVGNAPVTSDVDFIELAEKYELSGGHIKNAIINAARLATMEDVDDNEKKIRMEHLVTACNNVLEGNSVMEQSILEI